MAGARKPRGRGPAKVPALRLLHGDCIEVLRELEEESVEAVITDPPYGIGFKHERWDGAAIREIAAPSGRLSAGEAFQVFSQLWGAECLRVMRPGAFLAAFGSPRTSHRLAAGLEDAGFEIRDTLMWLYGTGMSKSRRYPGGRATTLKPAFEPIVLARKPLEGTTEETIARHGTGALNTDACRVGERHPANVLLAHERGCEDGRCAEGCAAAMLDRCAESRRRPGSAPPVPPSRFLYCPKVSRAERDAGCERLPKRALDLFPKAEGKPKRRQGARNIHPTVKPLELMRWVVRLVCPEGGMVLDPFCGSGTTGAAAAIEGRRFCGIEREPAYLEIAAARIKHWAPPGRSQVSRVPLATARRR